MVVGLENAGGSHGGGEGDPEIATIGVGGGELKADMFADQRIGNLESDDGRPKTEAPTGIRLCVEPID